MKKHEAHKFINKLHPSLAVSELPRDSYHDLESPEGTLRYRLRYEVSMVIANCEFEDQESKCECKLTRAILIERARKMLVDLTVGAQKELDDFEARVLEFGNDSHL